MSTTSSVSGSSFAGLGLDPSTKAAKGRTELGQDEFFELMIAQLENQDPMKPLDSNEFLGQVAQFSALSGIQEIQKSVADLALSLTSSQALEASTLVGREVLVPSSVGVLGEQGALEGTVSLGDSTHALTLSIYAPSGALVRQLDLGAQPAGEAAFQWDGLTAAGARAPAGQYTLAARAGAGAGTVAAATSVVAQVESVTLGRAGAEMQLNLAGQGSVGLGSDSEIQ